LYHGTISQLAEKLCVVKVLKGHGFSRADKANKMSVALATEGWFFSKFSDIFDFFQSLFSRAADSPIGDRALAPETCSLTPEDFYCSIYGRKGNAEGFPASG
jgi:hypothetical protein